MPNIYDTIELVGDKVLIKRMEYLKNSAIRKVMRPAISAGLTPIAKRARTLAPALSIRKLIGKKVGKSRKNSGLWGKVYIRPAKTRFIKWKGRTIDFGIVASFFEFGTKTMQARPFMRPAKEQARQQALNRVKEVAKEKFKKVVREAKVKHKDIYK